MIKNLLLLTLALTSFTSFSQTPCSSGSAGGYPCNGLTLQSFIQSSFFDAAECQDSWGWTDSLDGTEYAIVALDNGTAFVDISDPINPRYLGRLDSHSGGSNLWRDVKVYNNHAYIVSEVNDDGVQIFDLTTLRGLSTSPGGGSSRNFSEDGFLFIGDSGGGSNDGRAHNIVINEDSGYAYILGVNRSSNSNDGPLFVDLSNPTSPSIVGEYGPSDYFHDAQVVNYDGPDADYTGREIMIGCNENEMVIVDVTNKSNPQNIASLSYTNVAYTHQGWFTEDKRFFIAGDEVDEENVGFNTRTLVFDLEDLDNPSLHYTHFGATSAIDHNGYVRGNRFYLANYAAGVRVMKIDGLYDSTPSMTEVDFFDTYPATNSASFNGTWNVYPFFESGNLIASGFGNENVSGDGGLFILKDPNYDNVDPNVVCQNITATLDRVSGSVTISAIDVDGGSTDNIGITSRSIDIDTFTCDDLGAHTVTLTIEDDYGNKSSCTAIVTVVGDTTEPIGGGVWTNGTPNIGSNVKISSNYNTSTVGNDSFTACTCEVDASQTLTIAANDHIEITKDITVNGTLLVEHQGIVVQTDGDAPVTNNGTINVELTTPFLAPRDFMIMGSPMSAEMRNGVFTDAFIVMDHTPANFRPHPGVPTGGTNFANDNTIVGSFWDFYTGSVNVGEGYLVRPQENYLDGNATYDMTYQLGTLNNGEVSRPITYNGSLANPSGTPNILANPYASPISADDFIMDNALINELYFWEHLTPPSTSLPGSNAMNFSMDDISMYNLSMPLPAANDPGSTTTPNGVISTGQGFAIKAIGAGTVSFTNDMRLTSGNTTLRNPNLDISTLLLKVRNDEYNVGSNTGIAFNPTATMALDLGYDTERLATVVSLYSHLQDGTEQLGIQTLSQFENHIKVPMGFATQADAKLEYTISIGSIEGLDLTEANIFLIDHYENTVTNLKNESYTFESDKGTFNSRFTLQFEIEDILGPNDNSLVNISMLPNPTSKTLTIISPNAFIKSVDIYDIRGRRMQQDINGEKLICKLELDGLETGMYFVTAHTTQGSITKKILKH